MNRATITMSFFMFHLRAWMICRKTQSRNLLREQSAFGYDMAFADC
jgi:hypothetical protein